MHAYTVYQLFNFVPAVHYQQHAPLVRLLFLLQTLHHYVKNAKFLCQVVQAAPQAQTAIIALLASILLAQPVETVGVLVKAAYPVLTV